jgi:hypothetical protein
MDTERASSLAEQQQAITANAVNMAAQVAAQVAQENAAQVAASVVAQASQQAYAATHAGLQRELAKAFKPKTLSLSRKDTSAVTSFFYRMEKYFRLVGVSDHNTMVELATYAFDGDVAIWWRARCEGQLYSWEGFKEKVIERWCDQNDILNARMQLRNLIQRGSAAAVTSLFDSICLRIPNMADEEKRDRYLSMLKPSVQKEIMLCDGLDTYEKMAQKTILIDETLFQYRRTTDMRTQHAQQGPQKMELGRLEGEGSSSSGVSHRDMRQLELRLMDQLSRLNLKNVKCYNCGKMGHTAKFCRAPAKPAGRGAGNPKVPNFLAQPRPKRG